MADGQYVYLNDECLSVAEARVPVDDRAFLYGESVFTTLRCYDGKPFLLARHCERLNASLASPQIAIPCRIDEARLRVQIADLVLRNNCPEAAVRLMVSRGSGGGPLPPADAEPRILLTVRAYHPKEELYVRGAKLHVSSVRRDGAGVLERHKIGSYLPNLLARREAQAHDAHEAVLCSTEGDLLECACSNLFLVRGGSLFTPPLSQNLLPGITRACVLACASALGVPVSETPLSVQDLEAAEEIFLTNALVELLPAFYGSALPIERPVTSVLHAAYRQMCLQHEE